MPAIIKVIALVLFLGLIVTGSSQCHLNDLLLYQKQTGATIQGKPEWDVTIVNSCSCVQSNVLLDCTGFNTVESVDPSILRVSGESCLLNDGQPLVMNNPVNFKYAWDSSFPMTPIYAQISCS